MRRMIDAHHERAQKTGARIVHGCGFDSIPSDLGTWATQREFIARFGRPAKRVTAFFGPIKGGFSGGTIATIFDIADAMADRNVRRVWKPLRARSESRRSSPEIPPARAGLGCHAQKVFHPLPHGWDQHPSRSAITCAAGGPWGQQFEYAELMSSPGTARGLGRAVATTAVLAAVAVALKRPWLRDRLRRGRPQAGRGSVRGARPARSLGGAVRRRGRLGSAIYCAGDRAGDPGYGSTAKMLSESALCLALDP